MKFILCTYVRIQRLFFWAASQKLRVDFVHLYMHMDYAPTHARFERFQLCVKRVDLKKAKLESYQLVQWMLTTIVYTTWVIHRTLRLFFQNAFRVLYLKFDFLKSLNIKYIDLCWSKNFNKIRRSLYLLFCSF